MFSVFIEKLKENKNHQQRNSCLKLIILNIHRSQTNQYYDYNHIANKHNKKNKRKQNISYHYHCEQKFGCNSVRETENVNLLHEGKIKNEKHKL